MAEEYYGRQHTLYPSSQPPKRIRSEYDNFNISIIIDHPPGITGSGIQNYLPREEDSIGLRDTTSIGASYDRYLQTAQKVSSSSGESDNVSGSTRGFGGRLPDLAEDMQITRFRDPGHTLAEGLVVEHRTRLPMNPPLLPQLPSWEPPLPPNASDTIFVEGLPSDCTEREIAHIFRPFLGYKEVRLVTKEPKHEGVDRKIIAFVEFTSASCATTAMDALQGYKMSLRNSNSSVLKLQYSRFPDPKASKSAYGPRSKK